MLSLIQVTDVLDVALKLLDFPVPIDADVLAAKVLLILSTADSCAVCAAVGGYCGNCDGSYWKANSYSK
jgi:hypothetical protein